MPAFSFQELADIHFYYGRANGNALAARRLYSEAFPNRRLPYHTTFTRIHQHLREHGKFEISRNNAGRDRVVRTPQIEELYTVFRKLLQQIRGELQIPCKFQNQPYGEYYTTTNNILTISNCARNPQFMSLILFTDKAQFARDGIQNFHNSHIWAVENPHAVQQSKHQQRLDFLEHGLQNLLEEVPLRIHQEDVIKTTPGIFERVRQSMRRRIDACIAARGGHFEHFL
ncbi:hypothetical protein X777_06941 [Ooceraea biroi]|uniref:DUF4817 domain-containing protein n=1 Tax=Ooceraea biroi TaxID=2015173 RepID=A0A026WC01_OOCBI|nr:hypothetical protein X777_06941 [Ooceraea biroi]